MPNVTKNCIEFERELNIEEIENLKKKLFNDKGNVDFNIFVKQPENLIKVSLNNDIENAYSWYFFKNVDNLSKEELLKTLNSIEKAIMITEKYNKLSDEEKESIKLEKGYIELPNWFDWNNEHWGTKWGAYNTFIDERCLYFDTAWDKPTKNIIKKLLNKISEVLSMNYLRYIVEYEFEYTPEIFEYENGVLYHEE